MNHLFVRIVFWVILLVISVPSSFSVWAQTPVPATDTYVVKQDDTLYQLSAIYKNDPLKWREVLGANPFLKEPGRIYDAPNGKTIVVIRPGEELKGLTTLDIEAEILPFESLKLPIVSTPVYVPVAEAKVEWYQNPWLWLLCVVAGLVGLYLILRNLPESRRPNLPFLGRYNPALTANPITAAPQMVAGGISSGDHDAIRRQFQRQAVRVYASTHGGVTPRWEDIRIVGDIVQGTLHDVWETLDANGRWTPRRYDGEPGFQGMVSVNNAEPTLLTWSQTCANDLRAGQRYRGGRFVPATSSCTIPAQPPTPTPTPIRPHLAASGQEAEGPVVTVTVGRMRYSTRATDIHVNVDEANHVTDVRANGQIRVSELPKRTKPRAVRSEATGTTDK